MPDSLWITKLLVFSLFFFIWKRPLTPENSKLREVSQEIFFQMGWERTRVSSTFFSFPQGDISIKNLDNSYEANYIEVLAVVFVSYWCHMAANKPWIWGKLRSLLPSSSHEGKSCYLRLIRVQGRAQGAEQIKVNSIGLKGRDNSSQTASPDSCALFLCCSNLARA